MIKTFILLQCCFLIVSCQAQQSGWQWANFTSGPSTQQTNAVAVGKSGNIYVTGTFQGGYMFVDTFACVNPPQSPNSSGSDLFVAGYSPSGNVLWARGATPINGGINASGIATDDSENVYITGYWSGARIDIGQSVIQSADAINQNLFVTKLTGNNSVIWSVSGGGANSYANGNAVATYGTNSVYVAGSFQNAAVTFGNITLQNFSSSQFNNSFFIVKYDGSGNALWAVGPHSAGGSSTAFAVTTDFSGNIYVTGQFTDSLFLGDTVLSTLTRQASSIFIVKYDSTGHLLWARFAGGNKADQGTGLSTDKEGNVYITGLFSSNLIFFDSISLVNSINNGGYNSDFFIAKYNAGGKVLWVKTSSGATAWGTGIAGPVNEKLYVSGFYNGIVALDGNVIDTIPFPSMGSFVAVYDTAGNVLCTDNIQPSVSPSGIYVDQTANAYIFGNFENGNIAIGQDSLFRTGVSDGFLARYKCDRVAGINQLSDDYLLQLLPDPVNNQAIIKYKLPPGSTNASLHIHDITGREKISYQVNNNIGEINLIAENLLSGLYFYSLVVDGKLVATQKMVVQK